MQSERVSIIGVKISVVDMDTALSCLLNNMEQAKGSYICAANVHTTVTAHDNPEYREVQENSFLTLPDGKPLSVIGRMKGYKNIKRVTGPDFMENILKTTEDTGYTHFFYGTTEENLEALRIYLEKEYPKLNIAGFEPSVFRPLSSEEEIALKERIRESKADFVWVALGAPRQEVFCSKMCKNEQSVWIAVGGAFNVISGVIPRAPVWMQKCSLEWLFRLIKEPKRLFKRYFETNLKFIKYLFLER